MFQTSRAYPRATANRAVGGWLRLKLIGKFQQIPQDKANAGFYNFGTPKYGIAQYASPETKRTLELIGKIWRAQGEHPFGVGNITLMDGRAFDGHADHGEGRGVDIRPSGRTDGKSPLTTRIQPMTVKRRRNWSTCCGPRAAWSKSCLMIQRFMT